MTTRSVQRIDLPGPKPCSLWKKKYAAGLVRSATKVATRARRRSWAARATDSSLERSMLPVVVVVTSAVAMASQCSRGRA